MPRLSQIFKERVGRIFRRSSRQSHAPTSLVKKGSFDSTSEETLRLSESELSLAAYCEGYGSSNKFLVEECDNSPSVITFNESEEEEEEYKDIQADTEAQATAKTALKDERPKKKAVSFSHVQVRHYELILGDNPGIRYPLSIGWNYQLEEHNHVDDYEDRRARAREFRKLHDRISPRLYGKEGDDFDIDIFDGPPDELSLYERRMRLRAFGYSEAYLRKLERQRQCRTALEWGGGGTPRFPHCDAFIQRYSRE